MIEMACGKPMRQALTKPIAITVVALSFAARPSSARGKHAENGFSSKGKDALHFLAGDLLQVVAHHIHAENEDGEPAKQAQSGGKRGVHESFSSVVRGHLHKTIGREV
ncbi:MAG: hypothetical protein ACLT98_06360 [Eggerthellaceae bacterium]